MRSLSAALALPGLSAAYHLAVKQAVKNVVLADERPLLSLTSAKSTEAYRNWWHGVNDSNNGD